MNWSDITGGHKQQGQPMGGLLGNGMGMYGAGLGNAPQFLGGMYGGFGEGGGGGFGQQMPFGFMRPMFPQYGGNSRTAQMMNQYMGGLLSRRQNYMPPAMASRPAVAAPTAASYGGTGSAYDPSSPVTGG